MFPEVSEMGYHCIESLPNHGFHHFQLVVGFGFPLLNGYGSFRTMPDTGTKSVAHQLTDEPDFSINDLKGAFMTIWHAITTTRAFIFINPDNISLHSGYFYPVGGIDPRN